MPMDVTNIDRVPAFTTKDGTGTAIIRHLVGDDTACAQARKMRIE